MRAPLSRRDSEERAVKHQRTGDGYPQAGAWERWRRDVHTEDEEDWTGNAQREWGSRAWERPAREYSATATPSTTRRPLYARETDQLNFNQTWNWDKNDWESNADVIRRLQKEAGRVFVAAWHAACDRRDGGRHTATYDPNNLLLSNNDHFTLTRFKPRAVSNYANRADHNKL